MLSKIKHKVFCCYCGFTKQSPMSPLEDAGSFERAAAFLKLSGSPCKMLCDLIFLSGWIHRGMRWQVGMS